ncbi:MAG: RsbRD N-terminal domain-containing protein [Pseudomonadota bacterium]
MGLKELLEKHKSSIVKKWIDVIFHTYLPDTSQFLKSQPDPFANPVGNAISEGLHSIFDELISGPDWKKVRLFLDPIIRIRAIQNFTPSQSTSFILSLKTIVREKTAKQLEKGSEAKEIQLFDEKVDQLLFLAFDIYTECRERIYSLKANEEKNKVFKAFKRAGLIAEIPEEQPDLNKSTVL